MVGFVGILLWFAHYTLIGWMAFIAALIYPISMLHGGKGRNGDKRIRE